MLNEEIILRHRHTEIDMLFNDFDSATKNVGTKMF